MEPELVEPKFFREPSINELAISALEPKKRKRKQIKIKTFMVQFCDFILNFSNSYIIKLYFLIFKFFKSIYIYIYF